jgi:UDP-3-O-[3-hydroxymyristoyl] glucosamine N-acyltransferase
MNEKKHQFPLQTLIDSLPPTRRGLLLEVKDPASLSRTLPITGARIIELAIETEMIFCKAEPSEMIAAIEGSKSRFIVARPEILSFLPREFSENRVLILTPKPRLLMASLLNPFDFPSAVTRQTAPVHPQARIAQGVTIGPGAIIGEDVEIERGCFIGPNTVIDHATIGEETRIGFNCSIGSDGFGYEIDPETGEVIKFPHFGRVRIGKKVEIFSNTSIARGSLKDTVVEDEVKIDNQIHVAHNCHIKRGAFIIANVMLGGSVMVGEHAWLAPSTSVLNGITMGRCSMTGLGAVVTKPVEENNVVIGIPAKKLRNRFPADFPLLKD